MMVLFTLNYTKIEKNFSVESERVQYTCNPNGPTYNRTNDTVDRKMDKRGKDGCSVPLLESKNQKNPEFVH